MKNQTIKAIFQTAWEFATPYAIGLSRPMYCRIVMETNVSKFEIFNDRINETDDENGLYTIKINEHEIEKSYSGNIVGETIKSIVTDIYGDLWIVFESGYGLSNQVDNGNRLVIVSANKIEYGCLIPKSLDK